MPKFNNIKDFDKYLEGKLNPAPQSVPLIQKIIMAKQLSVQAPKVPRV